MKKKELLARIEMLEDRVRRLEDAEEYIMSALDTNRIEPLSPEKQKKFYMTKGDGNV